MMATHGNNIKIFAGNSHKKLAKDIAARLDLTLGNSEVKTFSDGEIYVNINETVRGSDVFLVQSTCNPVNDNIMELLIMIDALNAHRRRELRRLSHISDMQDRTEKRKRVTRFRRNW